MKEDTITAIATALGEAALSVIRVSGPESVDVVDKCFVPAGKFSTKPSDAGTHTLHYGHIMRDGRIVDEVLVAVMRAPRTFTREDVVEITCHGGPLPAKAVLDAVLRSGARMAEPGEFSRRAFLNGRIDLTQAEAVMDLIHSRTELAMSAASEQLAGKFSRRVETIRERLMRTLAHVEAYIDFPEEGISPDTEETLLRTIADAMARIRTLLDTADEGRVLRNGIRAAIIGRPNAGKSSLLNQLLGQDRAIVSHMPGTTRDTIEETASIHGIPVILIDTAGLREAGDEIEREGMRRARRSVERAELVIHVIDASEPLDASDTMFLSEFAHKKRILVRNKIDLPAKLAPLPDNAASVQVSCSTGQGIDELKTAIKDLVWSGEIRSDMIEVMINSRHQDALSRAFSALERSTAAIRERAGAELAAEDLRLAANAIGEITGRTATEDLLDVVFKQFCIGK